MVEVGGNVAYKTNMFYAQDAGRMIFVNNMAYQKKAGIQFSTIVRANKHFTLELNYQQNQFTNGYQFMQQASSSAFISSLLFSWAIREKGVILGDVFVPKAAKFPKLQIKVEKAWNIPSLDLASMDFLRVQFNVFHVKKFLHIIESTCPRITCQCFCLQHVDKLNSCTILCGDCNPVHEIMTTLVEAELIR